MAHAEARVLSRLFVRGVGRSPSPAGRPCSGRMRSETDARNTRRTTFDRAATLVMPTPRSLVTLGTLFFLISAAGGCQQNEQPQFSEQTYQRYPQLRPEPSPAEKFFKDTGEAVGAVVAAPGNLAEAVWPFKDKPPLQPERVILRRYRTENAKAARDEQQMLALQTLSIDMASGRAAITDRSGRSFPYTVWQEQRDELTRLLADRSFRKERRRPARDTEDPMFYELTVHPRSADEKPLSVRWAVPARKPLTNVHQLVIDVFEQAHRTIHPLSDRVDLLAGSASP